MIDRRAFVVAAAASLAACGRGAHLERLSAGEQGLVVSVRSGEVIILDSGLEVRLAGLEAPNGAEPLADAARDALARFLQERPVTLLYGGLRRDRYDRALAHVRRDDDRQWAQGEMLNAGLARVRTYADNRAMAAEMLEAEAAARIGERGLWQEARYQVRLPAECRSLSGFQVIEGRVGEVQPYGRGRDLLLAGGVKAEIPASAVEDFERAGKRPDGLQGRLVRVRGLLRGGDLRLDHPEALEMLREA